MLKHFRRSWALIKYGLWVLNKDRELLIFPFLSLLTAALLIVSFIIGFFPTLALLMVMDLGEAMGLLLLVLYYLGFYIGLVFIMIFFNAALTGAVLIRLEDRNPTLMDGLRVAAQHTSQILKWSIVCAIIGLLLRCLHSLGPIGRFIATIGGLSWAIATFFAIPILVTQKKARPSETIAASSTLIKKTWGESLIGDAGIAVWFILPYFAIATLIGDFTILNLEGVEPYILNGPFSRYLFDNYLAVTYMLLLLILLITFVFHSTLFSIFRTCLYQYTVEKDNNGTAIAYGGDPNITTLFSNAFREK